MAKFLLWNIDLTPDLSITNPFRGAKDRYPKIAQVLNQYDIVVVNESFLYRDEFLRLVNHPYKITDPKPCFKVFNSGVVILSKYPVSEPEYHHYTHTSYWDKFISKAILKVSFKIGNKKLDLYGTHMQQYNDAKSHAARKAQVSEIVDFVTRTHDPKDDLLLVGDLNMGPVYDKTYQSYPVYYANSIDAKLRDEQYQLLVDSLQLADFVTEQDICHLLHKGTNVDITPLETPDYKLSDTGCFGLTIGLGE